MSEDLITLIVGSEDRITFVVEDSYYNPQTKAFVKELVDLSVVTDLKIKWSLNGVAQVDITPTVDPDQVNNKGQCYHDWTSVQLATRGSVIFKATWTDGNARDHQTLVGKAEVLGNKV